MWFHSFTQGQCWKSAEEAKIAVFKSFPSHTFSVLLLFQVTQHEVRVLVLNYLTVTTYNRMEAQLHAFVTLVLDQGSDQVHAAAVLPTEGTASSKSLNKRLAGLYRRSRLFGEDILLPLQRIEPRFVGCLARGLVTVPTELSRNH